MPGFERVLAAYEHGLRRLADDLVSELDPPEDERAHLMLVVQLLEAIVRTYDAYQLNLAPSLEASKSVMYAAAAQPERRVLNVPLRSLVDHNTLSPWQARFIAGNVTLRRTLLITGLENVGKSTLLNALIDFIPKDARIVAIDEEEELPALRDRSFTVQLTAKRGTPARATTFRKAADMKPSWVIVGELFRRDAGSFFSALNEGTAGMATVRTPDPEATLSDWLASGKEFVDHLQRAYPLLIHVERDQGGRPRVERLIEVTVEGERLVLTPRKPL